MRIVNYDDTFVNDFVEMLIDYALNDIARNATEQMIKAELAPFIINQAKTGVVRILIALDKEKPVGFSIFQVDSTSSDFCEREGWGLIREFYVKRNLRGRGIGKVLCFRVETELKAMGAERIYLNAAECVAGIWMKFGYKKQEELCGNGQNYYEKSA